MTAIDKNDYTAKRYRWWKRYINLAKEVATWSEDRSTKVGAVIVSPDNRIISVGYNGFPVGVDQHKDWRHTRPAKYGFTEHAERNAIYNADCSLAGCTMFMNFTPCSCEDCTRAIIQKRIGFVVGPDEDFPGVGAGEHYSKNTIADEMFAESRTQRWVLRVFDPAEREVELFDDYRKRKASYLK